MSHSCLAAYRCHAVSPWHIATMNSTDPTTSGAEEWVEYGSSSKQWAALKRATPQPELQSWRRPKASIRMAGQLGFKTFMHDIYIYMCVCVCDMYKLAAIKWIWVCLRIRFPKYNKYNAWLTNDRFPIKMPVFPYTPSDTSRRDLKCCISASQRSRAVRQSSMPAMRPKKQLDVHITEPYALIYDDNYRQLCRICSWVTVQWVVVATPLHANEPLMFNLVMEGPATGSRSQCFASSL